MTALALSVLAAPFVHATLSVHAAPAVHAAPSVHATPPGADDPQAAVKAPDTPAGRQFAGWLGALGTGKPEALQRFFTENFSKGVLARGTAKQRAAGGLRLAQENGGTPELARIERSSAHELVALIRFPVTEAWLRVSVKVAPEPPHTVTPHTVTQWTVASQPPPDPGNAKRLSDEEIAARAEAYLAKLVAADLFSGSVVVAHDGKTIFSRAFGLASRAHGVPNSTNTKFNLGSMNKMFTAVAVAQLVEQGRLAFTDPVGKHLPDYPNKAVAEKVTLHHLLTHTSGVGDYFNDKYMRAAKDRFRTVQDFFPLFVDKPLEFEPGTRFRYSNAGFMILGAVIEQVSGQSYFDYVRDHVYKPAGMADTDAYEMDQDTPNLATGYRRMNLLGQPEVGPRRNNLFLHVFKGGPAGGGYSTAEDLIRFARALRDHRLLGPKLTELVMAGKVESQPREKYAYGFFEEVVNGHRVVGHGGGFPGINSQLDIFSDLGYDVAVMSNYDPPAAMLVVGKLRSLICRT
jgi:CubicO group peptidase (beta-lactamase class C family)